MPNTFFDLLSKLTPAILAIVIASRTWREYNFAEKPDRLALFGLIAVIFFSVFGVFGSVLSFVDPAKFKYNPFIFGWLLACCINWLTSPKYTSNFKQPRTVWAIIGIVFALIGIILGIMVTRL